MAIPQCLYKWQYLNDCIGGERGIERLWSKVEKTDSCWIWKGCLDRGYGKIIYNGKIDYVHRVSYILIKGQIPEGKQIDHLCRNRACVNPEHLEAVTQQENIKRGFGISTFNSKKTHCPKGHPYSGNNVFIAGSGRKCRTCTRENVRRNRAIHKEQINMRRRVARAKIKRGDTS